MWIKTCEFKNKVRTRHKRVYMKWPKSSTTPFDNAPNLVKKLVVTRCHTRFTEEFKGQTICYTINVHCSGIWLDQVYDLTFVHVNDTFKCVGTQMPHSKWADYCYSKSWCVLSLLCRWHTVIHAVKSTDPSNLANPTTCHWYQILDVTHFS